MREWINTVLIVILMIALLPITLWVKAVNDQAVANSRSGAQFEIFLHAFTAENNYACKVLWYENQHNPNLPYPPPISICNVVAP